MSNAEAKLRFSTRLDAHRQQISVEGAVTEIEALLQPSVRLADDIRWELAKAIADRILVTLAPVLDKAIGESFKPQKPRFIDAKCGDGITRRFRVEGERMTEVAPDWQEPG